MQIEPRERPPRKPNAAKLPLLIVVLAAIAVAIWFISSKKPDPQPGADIEKPAVQPFPSAVESAPDIPHVEPEPEQELSDEEPQPSLPPLETSDEYAREALAPLSGSDDYAQWLGSDNLLQKAVAFVDGLSRGNVLRKGLPVAAPEGSFKVVREEDRIWMDESNYARYDSLTAAFTSISPQALAKAFHQLRPLLEMAYEELGHPGDRMDNSIIAAIDQVLATPDVTMPLALKSESVAYKFADPALESLPATQKQLLRMGPDNAAKIKAHLREIREALLAEAEQQG